MENLGKLLLRVGVAGLMLPHGIHKLMHGIGGVKYVLGQAGMPQFLSYGVYVGEIVAPILMILGLYTRVSGLLISFTILVATAAAHAHEIFKFTEYGGLVIELNALYIFGALAVALLGPGKFRLGNQRGFWKE
ncbi:DoxX family protein [Marinifilum fragile]|uniref:DoxX family protein n=1 Tax=Marinifilum fragile TaxID=570161 RepID=UPI002AA8C59B|nr:DoxX family protein [Marinifilum fragile]